MPTTDELNAAFVVANRKVNGWVTTLLPNQTIPFVGNIQAIASEKLNSQQGRNFLLDEVRAILEAAEAVRAKAIVKD